MSEEKSGNKNGLIIGALVVAVLVLGFYLYKQSQTETATISVGDASISAEVSE